MPNTWRIRWEILILMITGSRVLSDAFGKNVILGKFSRLVCGWISGSDHTFCVLQSAAFIPPFWCSFTIIQTIFSVPPQQYFYNFISITNKNQLNYPKHLNDFHSNSNFFLIFPTYLTNYFIKIYNIKTFRNKKSLISH